VLEGNCYLGRKDPPILHPLLGDAVEETLAKVSVARCARVSYESFETGKRSTIEEDLKLFDRLVGAQPLHASPAEHQARPDGPADPFTPFQWANPKLGGNFGEGWIQLRKLLPGEACAPLPAEYRDA